MHGKSGINTTMRGARSVPYKSIPRVQHAGQAEIRHSVEADQPIILDQAIQDWKIFTDLAGCANDSERIDHLLTKIGHHVIHYSLLPPDGVIPALQDTPQKQLRQGAFSQFVREAIDCREGDRVYYAHGLELDSFTELGPTPIPMVRDWMQQRAGLWVGFGGQVVNLHYDEFLNCICMISGTKHVTLFPHRVLPDVYPSPLDRVPVSCVLLRRPDFTKFPRFRRALEEAYEVVLHPGDVLVLPPFWWHHVESFGFNVMINKFHLTFERGLQQSLQSSLIQGMRIFSQFPPAWRARYAACYDGIVFGRHGLPQSLPSVHASSADAERMRAADDHLAATAMLFRQLDKYMVEKYATTFHYYVFQTYGFPLAHVSESAYPEMVERLTRLI